MDTVNQKTKKVKKTPVEYVTPYNHFSVPNALDYARQKYNGDREYGLVYLAYEKGASQKEVAEVLGIEQAIVCRKYPIGKGGQNG